jgi:hypothetical protein
MADIDVVPKHRNYVWLWIVLAILVIAILFWALRGTGTHTTGLRLGGARAVIATVATPESLQAVA